MTRKYLDIGIPIEAENAFELWCNLENELCGDRLSSGMGLGFYDMQLVFEGEDELLAAKEQAEEILKDIPDAYVYIAEEVKNDDTAYYS